MIHLHKIRKGFGQACGDFHMVNKTDAILVPIDATGPALTLAGMIHYKATKMPEKPKIAFTFFHTTATSDDEVLALINETLKTKKIEIPVNTVKIDEPATLADLYTSYVNEAVRIGFNKVAIPDTIDFLNATMLATMCTDGVLNGPPAVQKVQLSADSPEVQIIRPFCYIQDRDLAKIIEKNKFPNKPGSVYVPESEAVKVSREAIEFMYTESSNIQMNMFHSQFAVQEKYLGVGDGKVHQMCEDEECP